MTFTASRLDCDVAREVAQQRAWTIIGEFVDRGVSGAKDRRPQLDAMMARIRRGGVDLLAVWRYVRFARSVRHLVLTLDELRRSSSSYIAGS
jgi:DNA invertase Pin-like site-specific DNA recombinase